MIRFIVDFVVCLFLTFELIYLQMPSIPKWRFYIGLHTGCIHIMSVSAEGPSKVCGRSWTKIKIRIKQQQQQQHCSGPWSIYASIQWNWSKSHNQPSLAILIYSISTDWTVHYFSTSSAFWHSTGIYHFSRHIHKGQLIWIYFRFMITTPLVCDLRLLSFRSQTHAPFFGWALVQCCCGTGQHMGHMGAHVSWSWAMPSQSHVCRCHSIVCN